ncbi:hypothetical protein M3Y94_01206800 [Aphelenchoides besseyi]|nr:hypothetical protein M3Y94_01206800 [Aphelenchoides besseyi]KAI6228490.1 Nuclear fallout [Aphelenchoides besseyi]
MKYLEASSDPYPPYTNSTPLATSASSNSVASRLYSNGRSRRTSLGSEPDIIQLSENESALLEFTNIATEMSNLSKRLADCHEEKDILNEERSRLRTETALLQERIHSLEDQFSNAEIRWEEKMNEERSRSKELVARTEREKQLELEKMGYRHQVLENEVYTLRKEKDRHEENAEELQLQLSQMHNEVDELKSLNQQLEKEKQNLRTEFENFKREATADIDEREELVEKLIEQTDQLRQDKSRPRQGSLSEQIVDLQEEIDRLRSENKNLRSQTEELRAQLLHDSVERGQLLLANGPSLAAEMMGDCDSDEVSGLKKERVELMNALRDQELCNQKLRSYIDNILSRVIEIYPEILEISRESQSTSTNQTSCLSSPFSYRKPSVSDEAEGQSIPLTEFCSSVRM